MSLYLGLPSRRPLKRWAIQRVDGDIYMVTPKGVHLSNAELWKDGKNWRLQLWTGDPCILSYDRKFSTREEPLAIMQRMLKEANAPSELLKRVK